MFRISSGMPIYLETLNNLELEIFFNLENPGILNKKPGISNNFNMFSSKISIRHKSIYHVNKIFCHHKNFLYYKIQLKQLYSIFSMFLYFLIQFLTFNLTLN